MINNVLIIKSLFAPNEEFFNETFISLKNMYSFIVCDATILLIGWIEHKFRNQIIDFINSCNQNTIYDFWDINYGKYHLFNCLERYINNFEYIFYCDHDILFEQPIENIITSCINLTQNNNIGLVAMDQKIDCRHKHDIYIHLTKLENTNVLYSAKMNIMSIALGCFLISKECFLKCVPLEKKLVYGYDDYELCKKVKKNGYEIAIIIDYYIIHPYNNNEKYKKWKNDIITYKSINYEKSLFYNSVMTYEKSLESSDLFFTPMHI